MIYVIAMILAYLFGSINFSIPLGKWLRGIDIREVNSKNAGTSNVAMSLGWRWGIMVLLLDMAKGFLPVLTVKMLYPNFELLWFLTGFAAIIGHVYPIFYSFKGGKGSATYGGMLFALTPYYAFIMLLIYSFILFAFNYVVLSTLFVSVVTPIIYYMFGFEWSSILILLLFVLLSIWKHKENYIRLLNGKEVGLRAFNKHKDKIRIKKD
jgi:glycerol-3-phosphate acyltransferase PlsY